MRATDTSRRLAFLWLIAGACGGDGVTPPTANSDPDSTMVVDSVSVAPPERVFGVLGAQIRIGAVALAEDGTVLYRSSLDPDRFSWSSSTPAVATIGRDSIWHGQVYTRVLTAVSEGEATITATSGGVTGSMPVAVRDRASLAWSVPIPTGIGAGNVMSEDGTIYVGSDDFASQQSLWYAVSPQGTVMWTASLPLTGRMIPAIGGDGTLYLGSRTAVGDTDYEGRLIALGSDGVVQWVLEDIDGIRSSPALGLDGTIYVAGGSHVYAVNPQGEIQWTYAIADDDFVYSSPAIAADGTIYVGGYDSQLYAIHPDGSLHWTLKTDGELFSSPAIGPDGTIYVGSMGGRLYAVGPDGTERWSVDLDHRGVQSSPSVGPDGTVYVMADGVTALNPDGTVLWIFPLSRSGATPILGADGTIYVAGQASRTRSLFALSSDGELLWDYPRQDVGGSPLMSLDGTIIAAAGDELIAVRERQVTNGGYAAAPWPTVRRSRSNTGRAGG